MTDIVKHPDNGPGLLPPPDLSDVTRIALVGTMLLLLWIRLTAFPDLTSFDLLAKNDSGSIANQIVFAVLGIVAAAAIGRIGLWRLSPLATAPLLLMLAWIAVTVVLSQDIMLSARRAALFGIVSIIAAAILLVPRSVTQLANVSASVVLIVLVVSYASLLIIPNLSMHTAMDVVEPEHAGAWRGVFSHKNGAGGAMAVSLIIGLFARSAGNRVLGTVVVVLSAVFLVFTYAKTSIALLPVVLVATGLCRAFRGLWLRALILLGPVALCLIATVGSVLFPAVETIVATVLSDPSFTGRSDIWLFALDQVALKPITGWGFSAFWTESLRSADTETQSWVTQQSSAHNAYLEAALCMGLPGLGLTFLAFLIAPFRNFQQATAAGDIAPVTMFFTRLWLFGVMTANFEGLFFDNTGPTFPLFLVSVFGLRYLASPNYVVEA